MSSSSTSRTLTNPSHCPWSGNPQAYDSAGRRVGPACPFMTKEQGLDFTVKVLGSKQPQPHIIKIGGYPPGLSVLDYMELAEAGKVFSRIDLMDEYKWNMMVLRLKGEPAPYKLSEILHVEKNAQLVLEPKEFVRLEIAFPGKKKAYALHNLPKSFSVKDLKLALIIRYDLPIGENRALRSGLYRASDDTFSNPFDNELTLYQTEINANEKLIFNISKEFLDIDSIGSVSKPQKKQNAKLPIYFWPLLLILIATICYVIFTNFKTFGASVKK